MASVSFNDGAAATLSNGLVAPMSRFRGWRPLYKFVGPQRRGLGTGTMYAWEFREDYGAEFKILHIPNTSQDTAVRLIAHLNSGGTCTVTTEDTGSRIYTCDLWPESEPDLSEPDPEFLEHALTLALRNTAGTRMTCVY